MTVDPKAHDEATAELYTQIGRADAKVASAAAQVHSSVGDKRTYQGRTPVWGKSLEEVLILARQTAEAHPERAEWSGSPARALATYHAACDLAAILAQQYARMETIYREHGWTRFFPCNNSNGHIHATLACHTLNKGQYATDMGWFPSLSGHTVEQAVAELGTWLCSVCFPEAPAEHCQTRSQANRAQRDADKAAKADAKFDKNLRPEEQFEDGRTGLRSGHGDRVTTVHGAKQVLREVSEFRHYSGINKHHTWYESTLAAAGTAKAVLLAREAHKPGTGATQAEIELIISRAEQKARKEAGRI